MSRTYNSVIVLGRALKDPKVEAHTDYGVRVTMDIVSQRKSKLGTEPVTVRVEARKQLAELCAKFIKKGREVLILGQLGRHEKSGLYVTANEVKLLGKGD